MREARAHHVVERMCRAALLAPHWGFVARFWPSVESEGPSPCGVGVPFRDGKNRDEKNLRWKNRKIRVFRDSRRGPEAAQMLLDSTGNSDGTLGVLIRSNEMPTGPAEQSICTRG
jgi:hypothetical protein